MKNYTVVTSLPTVTFQVMAETGDEALDIAGSVLDSLIIERVEVA
jgi:hypothetical protein